MIVGGPQDRWLGRRIEADIHATKHYVKISSRESDHG